MGAGGWGGVAICRGQISLFISISMCLGGPSRRRVPAAAAAAAAAAAPPDLKVSEEISGAAVGRGGGGGEGNGRGLRSRR